MNTSPIRNWTARLVPPGVSDEGRAPLWALIYLAFLFMNWSDRPVAAWLPASVLSVVVFLALFFSALRRKGAVLIGHAIAIGALGFALAPLNSAANTYLIYALVMLPFAGVSVRATMLVIGGTLILFAGVLAWLDWPMRFIIVVASMTAVISAAIALANHYQRERRLRQAELKLSHDEVRRLAALAERERIGRDLHDLLGHTLSLITLKAELAVRVFDRDPGAARNEIADVERVARDALAQVRRAVTGIRVAGFAAELASAKLLLQSHGVDFDYALADVALPIEVETVLAMVVREAVTNAQRHARAGRVTIALEVIGHHLRLRVEDDGRGGAIVPGNGLSGMRERLAGIGAELGIDSARGRGTRLQVSMPLPPQHDVHDTATAATHLRRA